MMTNIPTGTVTFLFSDIEGSTRRWEHRPGLMQVAFDRQENIMRTAMTSHGGFVYKMIGDAFQVAFSTAPAAVAAALNAQIALSMENWGEIGEIKVRMALHTGETEERGDDYVGPLLNRAARLMSAGHGGQVLLTQATAELVRDWLPAGVNLLDLGQHRLKDLERPEHVYQLSSADLNQNFPPLNTLDIHPNNLPVQLTSFIGRDGDLEQILDILGKTRLITITGTGGAGKTRLALQAAGQLIEAYRDGVFFVPLAAVNSPDFLIQNIASTLQFTFDIHSSHLDPKSQLIEYLSNRSLLLVLDNFEHLIGGSNLIVDLLTGAPYIRIIVTSRERLKLQGEWVYEIQGMNYPTNGSDAGLEDYSAVRLFVDRAQQVESHFRLSGDEVPCVKRICQLVQGIPLGIELAAAWLPVLTCHEIAQEIETSLDILVSNRRDQSDKHRSLRAAFDYSWNLIGDEQQRVFRELSLFRGGIDRQAAKQVTGASLQVLSDLVDKSLLHRNEEGRYEIHELLRQYAAEKLDEHQKEKKETFVRYSKYFIEFLLKVEKDLYGEQLIQVRDKIQRERENIRTAIQWAITNAEAEEVNRALYAYQRFFLVQGWHEGREAFLEIIRYIEENRISSPGIREVDQVYLCARANYAVFCTSLSKFEGVEQNCLEDLSILRKEGLSIELAICLYNLGVCACEKGEYKQAQEILEESLTVSEEICNEHIKALALLWLGYVLYLIGDYGDAEAKFNQSYNIYQRDQNIWGKSFALSKMGLVADALKDFPLARRFNEEGRKIFAQLNDRAGEGYTNSRLSLVAYGEGNYAEAVRLGRAGLEKFSEIGHRWGIGASLCRIGFATLELGDLEQAANCFQQAVECALEIQHTPLKLYSLAGMGNLLVLQGKSEQAVELIAFVQAHPSTPSVYLELAEQRLPELKSSLPEDIFDAAAERGKSLDLDKIIDSLRTAVR